MNPPKIKVEVGARSETGYVRNENQDRMSGAEIPLGQLYIVADGMGGHKGGAMAAELTIVGLQRHIAAAPPDASGEEVIRAAFKKVNENVYQKAHSDNPETEGMGSTAVLLLISNGVARLAHVGDSRAYLYRQDQLRQLTKDHTIVQKMVDAGMLTLEEAANHPNASVLERAVGSKPSVEVDISDELRIHNGDAILLCSDGLSGYVTDAEIQEVLRSPATVQQVTEQLVQLALDQGGEDNITVQFVQYGPREEALSRPKGSQKLQPIEPARPRRSYLTTAVVLFLFAAICAGLYFYFERKLAATKVQKDRVQKIAARNSQKLSEQLRNSAIRVEELRNHLAELKKESKSSTGRLTEELEEANAARGKAAKQANGWQQKFRTANADNDEAQKRINKLKLQLITAEAAKKAAKAETDGLRTQLDVAKKEMSVLKTKQAEVLESEESKQPTDQE